MTQLEIAQQHEIEQLQKKLELMKKLCTTDGFYQYYFSKLNDFKFNYECFAYVNDLYYKHFGVERYKSYESFRRAFNTQQK